MTRKKYIYRSFVPDQSKCFHSVYDAIINCGFKLFKNNKGNNVLVEIKNNHRFLYSKDGKYYVCVSHSRYNSHFFNIKMREIERGFYKEY